MTGTAKPHQRSQSAIPGRRIAVLLIVIFLAFGAVAARTIYLQSVKTRTLSKFAAGQQQNTQVLPAVRGDLLARDGQELAVGEDAVTFYATPRLVKDPVETALRLGEMLDLDQKEQAGLIARMSEEDSGFAYVARQVPRKIAQPLIDRQKSKVEGKKPIDGIGFYDEERRLYPLEGVAAPLLGTVDIDSKGVAGLEQLYDRSLSGRPGKQVVVRDPSGIPLDVLSLQREIDGRDVQLTIDATIQTEAERVLNQTVKSFDAIGATAIVMDPRTGEIYAMANVSADRRLRKHPELQHNRAIIDTYEPGSTFKIVTISAALEEGRKIGAGGLTPTTSFLLAPYVQVADRKIKDSHARGTVRMTTRDILVESSNVGTVTIAMRYLGKQKLDWWIRRFGFGSPTGIDFPREEDGILLDPKDWSGSTIGNVPIGQGIGVTAIQLASAYAAIANDGVMVQPHLLKKIEGETPPRYERRRVLSQRTSRIMRRMFGEVVTDEMGTGRNATIPGYAVAGKTGTANKAEGGVYVKGKYVSSFIGFVPARNPRLLTLVVVDEPNVPWGGEVAAPAFEEITEFSLQYLAIPPDGVL